MDEHFVTCSYYTAAGKILARLKRLTFRATLYFAAAVPWVLVAITSPRLNWSSPNLGFKLLLFGTIGVAMSFSTMLGALVWWAIAVGKASSNSILHTDAARQ